MNSAHSTAKPRYEFQLTIIESRSLITRLLVQLAFFRDDCKRSWNDFKKDPLAFTRSKTRELFQRVRQLLSGPNTAPAMMAAVATIT